MFIKKKCSHFIFQEDRNGEMAIGYCNAMDRNTQNHEGNYTQYECPRGLECKECYEIISGYEGLMKKL